MTMWTLHKEKLLNWEDTAKRAQEIGKTNVLGITKIRSFPWSKEYMIIYWQWE